MDVQYAIWDAYSADRSPFYASRLMSYVRKFNGTPVFSIIVDRSGRLVTSPGAPADGADVRAVVYDLQGGTPLEPLSGAR